MADDLYQSLLDVRTDSNSKTLPGKRLRVLRAYCDTHYAKIQEMQDRGASGSDTVEAFTASMDALIVSLYEEGVTERGHALPYYAVLAQGGYGRGALNPKSDIDLLFLFDKKIEEGDTITRSILHTLWDLHFEVGYSTRTLSECVVAAQDDMDSLTAMLEARFLAGNESLGRRLETVLAKRFFGRKSLGFIHSKIEERRRRHSRAGFSVQLLEPNIKESPGGLRDTHSVGWFLKARKGLNAPEGLLEDHILSRRNYKLYVEAIDFLLRTRNALHLHTQKPLDVLEHEAQPIVAKNLGYKDRNGELGVEQFMRDYYFHARNIKHISDLICERLKGQSSANRAVGLLTKRELDDGAILYPSHIGQPKVRRNFFTDDPSRLFSMFLNAQRFGVPLNESAQQAIKDNLALIDDAFRASPKNARIWHKILSGPAGIASTLRMMHGLDVLGAYIPEFGSLTCLVQYNRYHIYTADEHTLVAIENLERLSRSAVVQDDLRHVKRVFNEIPDKQLLYLALLLHDAGKSARDGDHSTTGSGMARAFLNRLNLPSEQTEDVAFLVQFHLTMSDIAQRRDLSDQALIADFASHFDHPDLLRMLYVLTYADLSAVTRTAWTAWKGHLLRELYQKAFDAITQNDAQSRDAHKEELEVLISQVGDQFTYKQVTDHLSQMPPRYASQNSGQEVTQHLRLLTGLSKEPVGISVAPSGLFSEIVICTFDKPFRLSEICGVLATHDINIFSAQAYTRTDGIVIDVFQVTGPENDPEISPELRMDLYQTLIDVFQSKLSIDDLFSRYKQRWARKRKPSISIPIETSFDNDSSENYTILDISAQDGIGLLYTITRTLSEMDLDIYTARIGTQADRAVDAFYVRKNGKKVTEPADLQHILDVLFERLS
ncbi:MAG: [protein-PII] uridylyltransferase [bacterium]|nr:[protein-PII] uridylyltransferase [bacterium]